MCFDKEMNERMNGNEDKLEGISVFQGVNEVKLGAYCSCQGYQRVSRGCSYKEMNERLNGNESNLKGISVFQGIDKAV